MKKLISSIFILFTLLTLSFAEENLLSFSVGISSGIPFYGSNSIPEEISEIDTKHRVIIGSLATVNYNVIKQITFFAGTDLLADFNWNSSEYAHHLHIAFPLGFKVYPGLGGLNLGLAYTLGLRDDFVKNNDGKENKFASWGNGFKVFTEYNFAHDGSSNLLPTIGCSWNLMPRGNNSYDNLLVFYIAENF